MVEALEGKLSAIYRWAKLDLGLALSSYVSKDSSHTSGYIDNSPPMKEIPEKPIVSKPLFTVNDNVILLSDDEGEVETSSSPFAEKAKDTSSKTNTTGVADMNSTLSQGDDARGSHSENVSCQGALSKEVNPTKSQDLSGVKETGRFNGEIANGKPQETPQMIGFDLNSKLTENAQIVSGSPSGTHNSLDRYYRQKGPRVAKVVRRINCNAEPLEFGVVQSGNSWCDNRAIYPKGFRSRVKYINISDPTDMCYYISEIQDAGHDRPLFMVSLEKCQNEVFIHLSAARCWEMVRERVNQEISKLHKLGRLKLPPLQPPGSLDGMEMFGFSSPSILQHIQSMDKHRLCREYWESRPFHSQSHDDNVSSSVKIHEANNNSLHTGADTVMASLFEKASLEELNILQSLLVNGDSTANRIGVARLLNEEIQKRPR